MMRVNEHGRLLALCLSAACLHSCTAFEKSDVEPIEIDQDLREYARQARANLARLTPERRAMIEPVLANHEQAIARYDKLMSMGKTRRAAQAPLYATGIYVMANDATGVGVADDVALPFVAIGLVAVALMTEAPASRRERDRAYRLVLDTGRDVSQVFHSEGTEIRSEPGTRDYCIDLYVDCQMNARRGFSRSRCQICMNFCLVNEFLWPDEDNCQYKPNMPSIRDRLNDFKIKI